MQESFSGRLTLEWNPTDEFQGIFRVEAYDNSVEGSNDQLIECPDLSGLMATTSCQNGLPGGSAPVGLELVLDDRNNEGCEPLTATDIFPAFLFGPGIPAFDITAFDVACDESSDKSGQTYSLDLSYDFGFAELSSQTAYQNWDNANSFDLDQSALAYLNAIQEDEYTQFSQEIRLTSPGGETIDWMVGFYYQESDLDSFFEWLNANGICNVAGQLVVLALGCDAFLGFNEEGEWLSAFASVTWNINDQWSIDFGLRWSDVEKTGGQNTWTRTIDPDGDPSTPDFGPVITAANSPFGIDSRGSINSTFTDSSWDPAATLNWQMNDDVKLYFKWAKGFKTGGLLAAITLAATPEEMLYDSEQAETFEGGIKAVLLDNRLAVNLAVFNTDYTDLQTTAFDSQTTAFRILNAAEATSKGLELEAQYLATENLKITFAFAYLDAKFGNFPTAACSTQSKVANTLAGAANPDICDRSGRDLLFAPEFNFSIGTDYTMSLSDAFDLRFKADLVWYDEMEISDTYIPDSQSDSYEKLNLRLALRPKDSKWEIAAYGRNVTDQTPNVFRLNGVINQVGPATIISGDEVGIENSANVARGASYGVQFNYNF